MPNGVIIYKGKSKIEPSSNIVVIATGLSNKSNNKKTGSMVQTWILCDESDPISAHRLKYDSSICGECKHRYMNTCYVLIHQAPNNIYKTYLKGKYTKLTDKNFNIFSGKNVRLGSYGDPYAVPIHIWDNIYKNCNNITGYTHQWSNKNAEEYKKYCMASVDTKNEYELASMLGWRTFRTRNTDKIYKNEVVCPSSKEAGFKLTCEECKLCNGTSSNSKKSITILVHGSSGKINNYNNGIKNYI